MNFKCGTECGDEYEKPSEAGRSVSRSLLMVGAQTKRSVDPIWSACGMRGICRLCLSEECVEYVEIARHEHSELRGYFFANSSRD